MDEYIVTLNGKSKLVDAYNPFDAALKAFPDSFKYRHIDGVHMFPSKENEWSLGMNNDITYIYFLIRKVG